MAPRGTGPLGGAARSRAQAGASGDATRLLLQPSWAWKGKKFEAWLCTLSPANAGPELFSYFGDRTKAPPKTLPSSPHLLLCMLEPSLLPARREPPENRRRRRRPLGSGHLPLLRGAREERIKIRRRETARGSGAARGRGRRPETSFFGKWGFVFPPPRRLNLTLLTPGATAVGSRSFLRRRCLRPTERRRAREGNGSRRGERKKSHAQKKEERKCT